MLIYAIDNEQKCLDEMSNTIKKAVQDANVKSFTGYADALSEVAAGDVPVAVFCEAKMSEMSGIEFAKKLRKLQPKSRVIFATAYQEYALEAFRIKAFGYLLKPLTVQDVKNEMKYIPTKDIEEQNKLVVKCFGHFDVFYDGKPVVFTRRQSKELLAYLIDREGAICSAGEISLALWEKGSPEKAEMQRVRNLVSDLKKTLTGIGMQDILIRAHRQVAVRKDMLDCDYYRMLEGDAEAIESYHGEYMKDFSWAELTNSRLEMKKSIKKGN